MRKILISAVLVSSISVSFAEHEWSYEVKRDRSIGRS